MAVLSGEIMKNWLYYVISFQLLASVIFVIAFIRNDEDEFTFISPDVDNTQDNIKLRIF